MATEINEILRKMKQQKPFVLMITNYFPIGHVASGIRALGAFPLMCNAAEEVEELLGTSKSVVINLGKLDNPFIKLCNTICNIANKMNIPIVLEVQPNVVEYQCTFYPCTSKVANQFQAQINLHLYDF